MSAILSCIEQGILTSFQHAPLPDETLSAIAELTTLTQLSISSSSINDRRLSLLAALSTSGNSGMGSFLPAAWCWARW